MAPQKCVDPKIWNVFYTFVLEHKPEPCDLPWKRAQFLLKHQFSNTLWRNYAKTSDSPLLLDAPNSQGVLLDFRHNRVLWEQKHSRLLQNLWLRWEKEREHREEVLHALCMLSLLRCAQIALVAPLIQIPTVYTHWFQASQTLTIFMLQFCLLMRRF